MPKKTKAPAYLRVAEGLYGDMLGQTKRSKIIDELEEWEDNELFIIAHLSYLKLQQGERIIELLEEIAVNTSDMADAAVGEDDSDDEDSDDEDSDEEKEDSDDEDSDEDFAEESEDEDPDGEGGSEEESDDSDDSDEDDSDDSDDSDDEKSEVASEDGGEVIILPSQTTESSEKSPPFDHPQPQDGGS